MSVTSIDHLVGSYHEGQRHVEANRPGGFDVDNELDLHSLLKWEVGRFGALEDLSSVESKLTLRFGELPVRKLAHHEIGRDARLAGATPLLAHSSRNSRAHCGSIHRDFRPLSPPQITQSGRADAFAQCQRTDGGLSPTLPDRQF